MEPQALSSSMEDYLETIYLLVRRDRVARTRDIAESLQVKMPSVTSALKKLAALELINYDPYQFITLTERGQELACRILEKHTALTEFFVRVVDIERDRAERLACLLEHHVDAPTLEKFLQAMPQEGISCQVSENQSCRPG